MQKAVRAACCSHVEGMNEQFLLTEDEAAFEAYLDTLAAALHHRSRKQPLRDYCTGLLLPEGAWSRPACPGAMHKTLLNFVSEGAWSDEAVLAAMRSQVLPAMQGRCASGSSTKAACPRRASTRSAWHGSIAARWARSTTAKSWSACRLPMKPPAPRRAALPARGVGG